MEIKFFEYFDLSYFLVSDYANHYYNTIVSKIEKNVSSKKCFNENFAIPAYSHIHLSFKAFIKKSNILLAFLHNIST